MGWMPGHLPIRYHVAVEEDPPLALANEVLVLYWTVQAVLYEVMGGGRAGVSTPSTC